MSLAACVVSAALILASACEREAAKREAKARVFAPPPPDPVLARAQEALDLGAMVTDPGWRDRVNRMTFHEIALRSKGVVFEGEVTLRLTRGDRRVISVERVRIEQGADGAFRLDVEMDGGDEQHIVFVDRTMYVRHNFGRWRASRDPTDERLRWREQAYQLWPSVYALFREQLQVTGGVATTHRGRKARRFALGVEAAGALASTMPRALTQAPEGEATRDRDLRLARRAEEWRRYMTPLGGSGRLIVDEALGVPLEVTFKGHSRIHDDMTPAAFEVELTARLGDIGGDPVIKRPKDYVEEFTRRKIVTSPLGFLDGGAAGNPPPAEPPDEDEAAQ